MKHLGGKALVALQDTSPLETMDGRRRKTISFSSSSQGVALEKLAPPKSIQPARTPPHPIIAIYFAASELNSYGVLFFWGAKWAKKWAKMDREKKGWLGEIFLIYLEMFFASLGVFGTSGPIGPVSNLGIGILRWGKLKMMFIFTSLFQRLAFWSIMEYLFIFVL